MRCCCVHVYYVVYKHFDKLLHIRPSVFTCVQNFRLVAIMNFEILGFKLKNDDNDKKNWRNNLFTISPMLLV